MNEKYVASLELCKRLKELGVKQESDFYWYCQVGGLICDTDVRGKWILRRAEARHCGLGEYVSAFHVGELVYMLTTLTKNDILIPAGIDNIPDYLAKEYVNEKSKV